MNENIGEKYLPIGSIVLLKGGNKKLMITGYCAFQNQGKKEMFDYCGCLYPEGIISSDQILLFDHSQISEVYFIGFANEEQIEFISNLKKLINNANNENLKIE